MKNKYKSMKILFGVSMVVIFVVTSLLFYNGSLHKNLNEANLKTLDEMLMQQKNTFVATVEGEMEVVQSIALTLGNGYRGMPIAENDVYLMDNLVKTTGFKTMILANTAGEALTNERAQVNIGDQGYFKRALAGEALVSSISEPEGKSVLIFAAPITHNEHVVGVIAGVYDSQVFSKLISPGFYKKGLINILDGDGEIILQVIDEDYPPESFDEGNIYWALNDGEAQRGSDSLETIMEKIENNQGGCGIFLLDGEAKWLHYEPVGVNDWTIFSVIPKEMIDAQSGAITQNAIVLTVLMLITICALVVSLTMAQRGYANKLYRMAYFDEMTGAPNLAKFKEDVAKLLKSRTDENYFLIRMDVSNFKVINEIYGMAAGDEVIKAISMLMTEMTKKPHCTFGRIHADEFVVIDTFVEPEEIDRTRLSFEKTFGELDIRAKYHKFEFRYGKYTVQKGETDVDLILEKINLAHRMARINKSSRICNYDEAVKLLLVKEAEIENKMDLALENDEFKLYLQPKYSLDNEMITGAEALVRWQSAKGEIISPGDFIPLFERNGFVTKVDMYLFQKVCQLIRSWLDRGLEVVTVSVNFSRLHLQNEDFVQDIKEIAERYQIPKHFLEVELTESTMFNNEAVLERVLEKLHQEGFTLSMDDFGTGYSSLGLLKDLPVDVIKIDRSFFANTKYKSRTKIVVGNVLKMARELGIQTVAEGVETSEHIAFLRELQCDMVQGYYYAKPMPAEALDLAKRQATPTLEVAEQTFELGQIGDIALGRQDIGEDMPVSVYRLFQFTTREALTKAYGEGEMIQVFRKSGAMAGGAFAKGILNLEQSLDGFIQELSEKMLAYKIGHLELEHYNEQTGLMVLTVSNDLECSGVSVIGKTLCQYDEGFIQGILEEYTKRNYLVVEVDCWGTGADICRFEVKPK